MQNIIHKKEKKPSWFPFVDTAISEPGAQPLSQIKSSSNVKLWQLDHNYHCAIIGTCLTMDEVKKILRQLHIGTNGFPPYELHTTIVTLISENNVTSKKVQRYLDKKFKSTVHETKKMKTNELKSFWKAALYSGKIIDAFWAVMSHPESDKLMKKTFYGDIHMLSHMSGASNRADLKRLSLLEKERKEYEKENHSWAVKYHRLTSENKHLMEDAKQLLEQLSDLENQMNALKNSLDQLMVLQSTKERQALNNLVDNLTVKLDCQEKEITKYHNKERQFATLVTNQKQQIIANNDKLLAYQNEVEYLQSALLENSKNNCPLQKQSLCGQCVLYVGGKKNLVPHYRELVEENSGIFLHHDGGIESNTQNLKQSLSKADVVVFPSTCISHDAYWKIKRTCNKQNKPYKYLKSSGLYSLSNVLNMIMSKIENQDTLIIKKG